MAIDCTKKCFKRMENNILTLPNDRIKIEKAEIPGVVFSGLELIGHRSIEVEVEFRKKRKDGSLGTKVHKQKKPLILTYCPFCGTKME